MGVTPRSLPLSPLFPMLPFPKPATIPPPHTHTHTQPPHAKGRAAGEQARTQPLQPHPGILANHSHPPIHSMSTSSSTTAAAAAAKPIQVKLVLLGEAAVGKSSLVVRFVNDEFAENKEPTIGAAFLTQKCKLDDKVIKYEIWVRGSSCVSSLARVYIPVARSCCPRTLGERAAPPPPTRITPYATTGHRGPGALPLPRPHVLPERPGGHRRVRHNKGGMLCWTYKGALRRRPSFPTHTHPAYTHTHTRPTQASLEKAKAWVKELQRQASPTIIIALVGNKLDLAASRAVPAHEAQEYATESNLLFFEVSAKSGEGVLETFTEIAKKIPIEQLLAARSKASGSGAGGAGGPLGGGGSGRVDLNGQARPEQGPCAC
jgi:Ras-related protein Rab-5C